MVEAVPFPAHQPTRHVDLLNGCVDDCAVARAAQRGEVAADRVVGGYVGDAAGGELEVVQVGVQSVAAGTRATVW